MMKVVIVLLFTSCLFACTKNVIIEDETPDFMVVNSLFTPDSTMIVNISESLPLLDERNYQYIEDATVELYEDSKKIGVMTYRDMGNYTIDYQPEEGKIYSVKASSSKGYFAEAADVIPPVNKIISIDTLSVDSVFPHELNCKIKFRDNGNRRDYYFLSVRAFSARHKIYYPDDYNKIYTVYYNQTIGLECIDEVIEYKTGINDITYGILFSDELINGKEKELTISINRYSISKMKNSVIRFYLKSVSENYYLYAKTYSKLLETEVDFMGEAVNVYSNIYNGFGIFGGYSQSVDSIIYNRD